MPRLAAAAALVALAGCWVPAERGRVMETRIQRLEDENTLVNRQLEEQRELLRDRVAKADEKIGEVQRKLDELNATAHRSGADVVARQDQMQQDLVALRGELETARHDLDTLRGGTDERFAALRGTGALDQLEARRKVAALQRPNDPQGLLAVAREQDAAGEKAVARELYEDVVKRWPKEPAAAEATFRLGELAQGDGKHREAVLAFGKVAQDFPRSERAPEAMLKTAESLLALNLRPEAQGVLRELQTKYPGTPAAKTGKARLDELQKPPRKK